MGLSSKQNASCRISQKLWPFHVADLIRPDAAPSGRRHHSRRHRSAGTIPARQLPCGRSAARPWQGGRRSRVPPAPWGRRMSNRSRDIVPPIAGTIPCRANTVPPETVPLIGCTIQASATAAGLLIGGRPLPATVIAAAVAPPSSDLGRIAVTILPPRLRRHRYRWPADRRPQGDRIVLANTMH